MDGQHGDGEDIAKEKGNSKRLQKDTEEGLTERKTTETKEDQRQRDEMKDNEKQKQYSKDATVIVNVTEVRDRRVEDVIKAVIEKVGLSNVLAVRPRLNNEYEITVSDEETCEVLKNGLKIKGTVCEVRSLQERECVVSFMHLPAYVTDEEITAKLRTWGVTTASAIRRRYYPDTTITDGTRFVRVKFPKEVVSLPYSTRFDTAEGVQYFRIIHDRQMKICRLCMKPGHMLKDCPDFKCRDCGENGHFARECDAVRCPECSKVLVKCECWMEGDSETDKDIEQVDGTEKAKEENNVEETQTELMEEEDGNQQEENADEEQHYKGMKRQQEEEGSGIQMEILQETREVEKKRQEVQRSEKAEQGDKKEDNKEGWERVTTTRRRQLKVTPNLEEAKKRHIIREKLKDKEINRRFDNENSFGVLMELEENDECLE